MPNTNPTIVSASLSDKDLQDSINKMVANFDKGLQTMLEHSNKYVGKIQESLQKIGNTNFGATGSNDGAVVKQTKAQKEATNETERRLKKEKEVNLTLDQQAEIMGRIPREMRMPDMAKSARDSFGAFFKGFKEQARQLEPLIQSWEKLLQSRHNSNIEQVTQKIRNVKSEIASLIREQSNLNKTKPQGYLEEIGKRNTQIKALRDQLASLEAEQQRIKATDPFKGNPYLDTLREKLQAAKVAMNDIDTTNRQWLYRTNELTEAQRKLATESMKSFYAHTMKMPTDQYDVQLAKLENIRALLQRVRSGEATFFTPTQVTGLEKEERRLVELIGQVNTAQQQVASSTQQTAQSAQRYTEEIRKQAQAIRESQQWKEKGFITADGSVLSNQENVAKKKRISLEEQILNLQQQGIFLSQDQTSREWQLVDASGKRIAVIQKENENLATQRERVAEISSEVRRMFTENNFGRISFTPAPLSGVRYIYQENDERSKGLTIEQQIERILKEQSAEYERQASIKKASNNGSQRTLNDLQSQARAIEELLEKGKRVKALGGFEFIPADMSGLTVMQQILSYQEQRKSGLLAENQALNLQLELSNAIAQAQEKITQEQEKTKKKYVSPTANDDYYQNLRNAIANKLGVDTSKVINADAQYDSVKRLSGALKQLQDAYARMTNEERNSPIGKQMLRQMQELERQTQQLRKEMSRPVSLKDALGGSEKTLDDIAYKMQRLRAYKQGIDLTKPNAANEIKQVDEALARLQKDADKWMSKSREMIKNNTALGRSWNYMKNRLAFYFTVGASTQFVKNLIEVRSQYEMNERALGILIDSAERGTQIFNELSQMALVSPYTLIELSTAAKQLTAYDIAAKDVVNTTRRLADMTAAVGIPIERLTYALGQIKAYGYLNARDARMFSNAGIPLVKQLSEYYTELEGRLVSTADVYDRIKKKTIDFNEVMEVINKMTDEGGKFFDFQAKMADTLKVRLANLTLAWNNMLNEIGKSNQGLLTFGIGALKELFLQWKKFSSAIYSAAWAGGLVIAIRALNVLLVKAGFNLRILSKDMTAAGIAGQGLATKMRTLGSSIASVAKSSLTWWTLLAFAVVDAAKDLYYMNEAQENLNKSIRDGAKDNYDNISKFLEQYKEVREGLYKTEQVLVMQKTTPRGKDIYRDVTTPVDIDKNEAKKAWEAIREQIELTSQSSDVYISKLLTIENMSERVRQGFNILDDIQVVNAALKELDDDTIKVSKDLSAWWNAWQAPDGLITNLKDLEESEKRLLSAHSSVQEALATGGHSTWAQDYLRDLERVREDLKVTTDSILNFIELKGWSGDESKINQVFEQITQKIILDNQLNPQKAFTLQTEIEEARSKAAKNALVKRIQDEQAALKVSYNQDIAESLKKDIDEYKHWDDFNGRKKVEWERFTKWLKEQHISETTQMFRNMDAEDIKSLNFQEGKHAEWVDRMVTKYAKEHKMSYDEAFNYLKSRVRNANTWSIFIPLIISTEDKKSVYDQLGEYDKAIDDADSQIARLTKRIGELRAKRNLDKKELQELVHAQQELTDAEKAKADAEAKGGHGKKEAKDERAARKAAKEAESELAKALKEELSTIDKVRSIYKDLTKEGMSHANAVERATRGWDETVNAINHVLQKNGLQKLDLSKFVGIENPRELVNMLQSQLNALLNRGAKPAEIKELQTKVNTLEVEADKYDLTMITKGLNNELGKLKEEYELAVELDANPELGDMFAQMFGIDTSTLPQNIYEYIQAIQDAVDSSIQEVVKMNPKAFMQPFDILTGDVKVWAKQTGQDINGELVKGLISSQDAARGAMKKYLTDIYNQTKDLEYKLADTNGKIAIEEKKLSDLQIQYSKETTDERRRLLELQIKNQEQAIAKLKESLLQELPAYEKLFGGIAEHSAIMTRRLARNYRNILDSARHNEANNTYTITDGGKTVTLTEETYYKERKRANDELRKAQAPINKIKEAFTKGEDKEVDFWEGIELISDELQKLSTLADNIGNLAETLGFSDETVETIKDVAASIGGAATMAQGITQIASGDYIGGAASVISGFTEAIGAWFDNSDKKIQKSIKESERAVNRLELAYIDLEHAVDKAYGTSVVGAKQAVIANKKLQLAEIERQIQLEKSRKAKNRDEDRIIELQKQYKQLKYEIKDTTEEIVNDLLGISSVGDAAENLVSAMIDAFKQGEDYMAKFDESFGDMIDNMIVKAIASEVIGRRIKSIFDMLDKEVASKTQSLQDERASLEQERQQIEDRMNYLIDLKNRVGGDFTEKGQSEWNALTNRLAEIDSLINNIDNDLVDESNKVITPERVNELRETMDGMRNGIRDEFLAWMDMFGIRYGESASDTQLSQLQQGIQGITEDTAGALEAYMNGVSQQVYLHSDLLMQIRDAIVGFDMDVQLGVFSQMLLQLQQSYQVQQNIESILTGVLNPSGRAFTVELAS